MTMRPLFLALAGGLSILGCATTGVNTDYDRQISFAAYRTYAWVDSTPVKGERKEGPFFDRRLRRAVERALDQRGFAAAGEAKPDLLVTAFLIGPTEGERGWRYWPAAPCGPVGTIAIGIGIGYPYGYGHPHAHWPWRSPFYRYPWGYACGYRVGFGYFWIPVYEEPDRRLAGTIVIDILDGQSRELIWRGSEEGVIREAGESLSQEELDQAADRILHEFPPPHRP